MWCVMNIEYCVYVVCVNLLRCFLLGFDRVCCWAESTLGFFLLWKQYEYISTSTVQQCSVSCFEKHLVVFLLQ